VPYLGDLMRLAALTGARPGALVELRVKDCEDGVFLMPPQKSEPGARRVPIHSDLVALVARRCEGKVGDDWLFPEVPPCDQMKAQARCGGIRRGSDRVSLCTSFVRTRVGSWIYPELYQELALGGVR
jgi:integrase